MEDFKTLLSDYAATHENILEEAKKFANGNKTAGTRLRNALLKQIGTAKELRKQVQTIKKA